MLKTILATALAVFFMTAAAGAPAAAQTAAVVINEIAWAGTAASASDEWLELYNPSGGEVDLTGWFLRAADGTPNIALSGVIPAGGFFLLERTDDATVSDVEADLIYTGALSNEGEVLELLDDKGRVVDRVSGWYGGEAGGRASMERKNAGGSGEDLANWQTNSGASTGRDAQGTPVAGTPRAANSPGQAEPPPPETSAEPAAGGPAADIGLTIAGPSSAALGASVNFSVTAHGFEPERVEWNFGDGLTGRGLTVSHRYRFPGRYLVAASAAGPGATVGDQRLIEILETAVRLSEFLPNPKGRDAENEWIELANDSDRTVDLSGWRVETGGKSFVFAERSFMLPGQYLVLPRSLTKLTLANAGGIVRLTHASGQVMDEVRYGKDGREGWSAARRNEQVLWTRLVTPGGANVIWGAAAEPAAAGPASFVRPPAAPAPETLPERKRTATVEKPPAAAGLVLTTRPLVARAARPEEWDEVDKTSAAPALKKNRLTRAGKNEPAGRVSGRGVAADFSGQIQTGRPRALILLGAVLAAALLLGLAFVLERRKR